MPTITCKVSPDLDARLAAVSRARGTTKSVVVRPDGKLVEQFSVPAPKGTRTAYKVMENPRFGLESLGYSIDIRPLLEHQHR